MIKKVKVNFNWYSTISVFSFSVVTMCIQFYYMLQKHIRGLLLPIINEMGWDTDSSSHLET